MGLGLSSIYLTLLLVRKAPFIPFDTRFDKDLRFLQLHCIVTNPHIMCLQSIFKLEAELSTFVAGSEPETR